MKKLIYILSLSFIVTSCHDVRKDYPYRIEGNIKSIKKTGDTFNGYQIDTVIRPAIAYTDSIYGQNEDSIWYYNSDGSKLTILAPYKVYKSK
jgi:hypothetical protein